MSGRTKLTRCMWFAAVAVLLAWGLDQAEAQGLPESGEAIPPPPAPPAMAFENPSSPQFVTEEPGWSLGAGADLIVIVPRFESNPAYTTSTVQAAGIGPLTRTTERFEEFHYDYALSPRVWLGAENKNGVGARMRWWHFNQSAPTLTVTNSPIPVGSSTLAQTVLSQSPIMAIGPQTWLPTVPSLKEQPLGQPVPPFNASTDTLTFGSGLTMDVWDFEGTLSDLTIGQWSFLLGGGLRYAHLNQTYNVSLAADPTVGKPPQFLNSSQAFDGLGPTLGVDVRRAWDSLGLSLVGGARVAFLFGPDRHTVTGLNTNLYTQSFGFQSGYSSRTRAVPVVELELGAERAIPLGNFDWILRGSVLSQLWPVGSGPHGNGNMALIGFTGGTGLRF